MQIVMMHVGQNKKHTQLEKINSGIAETRRLIDEVNDSIKFARRMGHTDSIARFHQPWKDYLLADYARLAREEIELQKSL